MPPTVDAVVLLGWMEREFAIKYLTEDCVFDQPITAEEAEALWREYHERVQALPERDAIAPTRLQLTNEEQNAADQFLEFYRNQGPHGSIRDVIKIDQAGLVAYQFYVVLDRVAQYSDHVTARTWCARNCLSTNRPQREMQLRHGLNAIDVVVPHGEFALIFSEQNRRFDVIEQARHVSVTEFQNRMLLWAGYHRSYARMASANPDGTGRSILVVLSTDADFLLSPDSPNQGLRAMVCGRRPALFGDFFDERFFIRLKLRKKRYELQIRAQIVPINDES